MIAKATVYLDESRTIAVPEGDKRARFKLIHEGHEISPSVAERYKGAIELIGGTKPVEKADMDILPPEIETRDPEPQHRDPRHHKKGK